MIRYSLSDLVGASDIADMAHVTRAAVSNWQKRSIGFPKPIGVIGGTSVWYRPDVARWLEYHQDDARRKREKRIAQLEAELNRLRKLT